MSALTARTALVEQILEYSLNFKPATIRLFLSRFVAFFSVSLTALSLPTKDNVTLIKLHLIIFIGLIIMGSNYNSISWWDDRLENLTKRSY